jgi:hypothetical protein
MIGKFLGAFLERHKNPKVREIGSLIKDLPSWAGRKAYELFWRGRDADGNPSVEAVKAIEELKQTADTQNQREPDLLDELANDLNSILEVSRTGGGLALRGFLHSSDCVSYWMAPLSPKASISKSDLFDTREVMVYPQVEIFLLPDMSDPELDDLNQAISVKKESAIDAALSKAEGQVMKISLSEVFIEQQQASGKRARKSPVTISKALDKSWRGLRTMVESVERAKQAQARDLEAYRKAKKRAP